MASTRRRKDVLYGGLAAVVKALGNPHRLELLDLLAQAPRTVEVVADMAALSVANASQHLQVLRAAGLVDAERRGAFVVYRLADQDVADTVVQLRRLAARDAAEAVDRETLLARVRRGDVVLLDVRPPEEFAAGRIPGARSVPIRELKARIDELPRAQEIVAYCRGPFCVYADDAVRVLRDAGRRASTMKDGVAEWRAAGFPLETEARS